MNFSLTSTNIILFLLPRKLIVYQIYPQFLMSMTKDNRLEYELSPKHSWSELFVRVKKDIRPKLDDKWYLGLPFQYFSLVNFTLPKAAEENLDQAVRYALMRHVPYDISSVYMNHQKKVHDEFIEISASIAPKKTLQPVLDSLFQAGINITSVFPSLAFWAMTSQMDGVYFTGQPLNKELIVCQNKKIILQYWESIEYGTEEETFFEQSKTLLENITNLPKSLFLWESDLSASEVQHNLNIYFEQAENLTGISKFRIKKLPSLPYSINMVSKSALKQKKIATAVQIAIVAFFGLALLSIPIFKIAGKKKQLIEIEQNIAQIQKKAQKVRKLRDKNQELADYLNKIASRMKSKPLAIELLKEITEVIPQTAWLYSCSYSDQKISINGQAESATAVIEALENSPLFQEAHFDSPVRKSGSEDRFKIICQVVLNE